MTDRFGRNVTIAVIGVAAAASAAAVGTANLNPWFTAAYLLFAVPLVAVELYGVWRTDKGDTISEHIWTIRNRWPWLVVPIGGFLVWLLLHFTIDGW